MKNALELAEEHCLKTEGFVSKVSTGHFFAGYDVAHEQIVSIINNEIQVMENLRPTTPESGRMIYALKNILSKICKL